MGYTIAIRARNPKLHMRMVEFMNTHWRKWSDVLGKGESISSSRPGPDRGDTLSYDRASNAVGFDYASHCYGWESCLIFCQTRWMALKIGRKKSTFSKDVVKPNVFKKPFPFMVYDGDQTWPIVVVKDLKEAMKLPKTLRWCAVDKLGVYIGPEVNEILTTYTQDVYADKTTFKAYAKDLAEITPIREKNLALWRQKFLTMKIKYMRQEIDAMLSVLRDEIERLDKLWERA